MSAEIVDFPSKAPAKPGNGAREAIMDYITLHMQIVNQPPDGWETFTDHLLAELWLRGFKVVPLE